MENRTQEAIQEYGQALRLQPEMVPAMNNLAWILATDPDDKLRNGARAIQLAERACELTGHQQAFLLGTLAAAYAEAGRFAEATNSAQTAANIAIAAGQREIAATNEKLLDLYRAGKPYHEARKPN